MLAARWESSDLFDVLFGRTPSTRDTSPTSSGRSPSRPLVFLVGTVVLYNVRSRQLHRHEPLRTLQEWLLWTGLATFGLILVGAVFRFYFLFVFLFIVGRHRDLHLGPLLPLPADDCGVQRAAAPRSLLQPGTLQAGRGDGAQPARPRRAPPPALSISPR